MTETGRKDETLGTAFAYLSVYIITNQIPLKGFLRPEGLMLQELHKAKHPAHASFQQHKHNNSNELARVLKIVY